MFVGQVVSERHSKADKMGDWGERITVEEVLKLVPLQGKDRMIFYLKEAGWSTITIRSTFNIQK